MNSLKFCILTIALTTASFTHAESVASEHSRLASKHSALAAYHSTASTVTVASAVVAAPVLSVGALSVVSGTALVASSQALVKDVDNCRAPLIITEKVITIDPAPDVVVNNDINE